MTKCGSKDYCRSIIEGIRAQVQSGKRWLGVEDIGECLYAGASRTPLNSDGSGGQSPLFEKA